MQPTAIVLHGPTSAGKTTLAKALQATSPAPAFHVSLDAFVTMSNRHDMRSDEERARAYKLHCENLRSTLSRVAQTEFDIILDLVLRDETELQACLKALGRRPTFLIGVSAPLPVLEARERERSDRASGIAKEQAADPVYSRQYDLSLDTSRTTPEAGAVAIRKLILTALPGLVLALQAMCAFASGREGDALVEPVRWIVAIVLICFATLVFGGSLLGAFRASRSGESILKGSGRGLLRGLVAFLVVGAASVAVLSLLGLLYIGYSFLYVNALRPS
jgi:chloramphenicol 3-O phosphotransferase